MGPSENPTTPKRMFLALCISPGRKLRFSCRAARISDRRTADLNFLRHPPPAPSSRLLPTPLPCAKKHLASPDPMALGRRLPPESPPLVPRAPPSARHAGPPRWCFRPAALPRPSKRLQPLILPRPWTARKKRKISPWRSPPDAALGRNRFSPAGAGPAQRHAAPKLLPAVGQSRVNGGGPSHAR